MNRGFLYGVLCTAIVFSGWGCGSSDGSSVPLTRIDDRLPVYVRLPEGWGSVKLNTLQKDPRSPSGLSYVDGGTTVGFGTFVKKEELAVRVQVIAIPKSRADVFEKNKYPSGAVRRFETPEHFVYTFVPKSDDAEAQQVVASVQYKQK